MDAISRISQPKTADSLHRDPTYLTLSRMLTRFQYLILLTPTSDENLNLRLAGLQKQTQAELWSPLPFHRTKWLHSIEGARNLLLKLEQSATNVKVQRAKREIVRDLAQKRNIIKRLRIRVEEIGNEADRNAQQTSNNGQDFGSVDDSNSDSMLEVLQQIRRNRGQEHEDEAPGTSNPAQRETETQTAGGKQLRQDLFETDSSVRRRQGKDEKSNKKYDSRSSGQSAHETNEQALLNESKEHESITTSLLDMAAQLKQQARQTQFTLEQDKGLLSRALEGLDQNVAAMGIASKGMKTLQRMNEEQGFWGRLKLQALIAGMWLVAIILVFVGPKLRF